MPTVPFFAVFVPFSHYEYGSTFFCMFCLRFFNFLILFIYLFFYFIFFFNLIFFFLVTFFLIPDHGALCRKCIMHLRIQTMHAEW